MIRKAGPETMAFGTTIQAQVGTCRVIQSGSPAGLIPMPMSAGIPSALLILRDFAKRNTSMSSKYLLRVLQKLLSMPLSYPTLARLEPQRPRRDLLRRSSYWEMMATTEYRNSSIHNREQSLTPHWRATSSIPELLSGKFLVGQQALAQSSLSAEQAQVPNQCSIMCSE